MLDDWKAAQKAEHWAGWLGVHMAALRDVLSADLWAGEKADWKVWQRAERMAVSRVAMMA